GVDLGLWRPAARTTRDESAAVTRYVFVGRLVDWKAVDLLLFAFARARAHAPMSLLIIGDGPERRSVEQLAVELGVLTAESDPAAGKVRFCGWLSQADCAQTLHRCDALVLPSLMECGGAVVLEAMAMQLPVIATAWGGPADYVDASCGILVEPASQEGFVDDFASALVRLARCTPDERAAMGKAGRARVVRHFDWDAKLDRILDIYRDVLTA
ncbi:MAG TPA: glycosyltransferase family 4 protein, partial [Burkholderiales bacterium]|nr:glycosyltransferase family 4 protein [Burkholderiales bacterium]